MDEHDPPVHLGSVEGEHARQRTDGLLWRLEAGQHEPLDRAGQAGCVDLGIGQPRAAAQVAHKSAQRHAAEATIQPMAQPPVFAVRPDLVQRGIERIGAGIPGPRRRIGNVDGTGTAARGQNRVVRRIRPEPIGGLEIGPLHRVVAPAPREIGQERLAGLRVKKHIGLVRTPVDRRAAQLGEANGLRAGRKGGRGAGPDAAGAVAVRGGQPFDQALVRPDPMLAVGRVVDRGAGLALPVGVAGIIPVIQLAPLNVRPQIGIIEGRQRANLGIEIQMILAVAPVGDGKIVVDSDEVDSRVCP